MGWRKRETNPRPEEEGKNFVPTETDIKKETAEHKGAPDPANLLEGLIGSQTAISVEDVAKTQGNTYYTEGQPIDHILGETGYFERIRGGLTGQGVNGQWLNGADHFPVFAEVMLK